MRVLRDTSAHHLPHLKLNMTIIGVPTVYRAGSDRERVRLGKGLGSGLAAPLEGIFFLTSRRRRKILTKRWRLWKNRRGSTPHPPMLTFPGFPFSKVVT